MLRIGQVETTATSDNKYTDGSVAGGVAATRLRAAAFNAIQEELANIVESAGLTLNVNDQTQVLTGLKKLFLSRSNPFADIKADGSAALAVALSNLGLGEAAKRSVGTGNNQIPDMSSFPTGTTPGSSGWLQLPNGWIIQSMIINLANGVSTGVATYPIVFPTVCVGAVIAGTSTSGANPGIITMNGATGQSSFQWWRFTSTSATSATIIAMGY